MADTIRETAAQVAGMIPRFSWEIMTEEQRDVLMREVVLPRYNKVTSDRTTLGPTWWGTTLGTTEATIRSRVARLNARSEPTDERAHALPNASDKSAIRSAKSAIRQHPEMAEALLNDPDVLDAVKAALPKSGKSTTPKTMDDRVDGAINTLVQGLLKRDAGEWEPNNWTLGKLHFVARWIIGQVEAPEDSESFISEATSESFVDEVYAYLQKADRG